MTHKMVVTTCLFVFLMALAVPQVWGDIITIDGRSDDWASPDSLNHDTVGDVYSAGGSPQYRYDYDIEWNYYEYSEESNPRYAFATLTVDNLGPSSADTYWEILLNTQIGKGVGGTKRGVPDLEYYITWDLGNTSPASLYKWTGTKWQLVPTATIEVRRGTTASGENPKLVELAILASDLGTIQQLMWGAYLDNGGVWSDDYCPDWGVPDIPEPGTLVLGALALMGGVFAGHRRRSRR